MLLLATALAATTVTLDATVGPGLDRVEGTITVTGDAFVLVDPLARLPIPDTDELIQATFPGAIDAGELAITDVGGGTWTFSARLPRRYGDIGAIPGRGLFGNGGWYPQPMVDGHLPVATWDVTVRLPDGAAGSVGDVAGEGTLHWAGEGERASLAALPRGVVTPIEVDGARLSLVTEGRPRAALVRFLGEEAPAVVPQVGPGRGVIVEAPLRRRLVSPGVRMTYLSDRAWRLTPGVKRFHHVAVMRGVASALLDQPDAFARDIAASTIAARYREEVSGASAGEALRWIAWVPLIDKMLTSRHTPFIAEILEEALPGDPLRDDLVEVLDPHWPGSAVVAQVDDAYGAGTAAKLGLALEAGATLDAAATAVGVDPAWLASLRGPLPTQDYTLAVDRGARVITVRREAPPDAPGEVVVVTVDGEPRPLVMPPGPETLTLTTETPPRDVALDPERHVAQTSTVGDTWPPRYTPVVAAWFSRLDVKHLRFDAFAQVALRRQYDTRWLWKGKVYVNDHTLVGGEFGYTRQFGPELDGFRRLHAVGLWVGPALLPAVEGELPRLATAAGVDWTWDNRVATYFPLRGHQLRLGIDAGLTPGTPDTWQAVRGSALGIVSPHPRVAFPLEVLAGAAVGTVESRLVDLGGLDGMRSLPTSVAVGNGRGILRGEVRWAFLHNAAIPALVLWGNELSASVGVEGGAAAVDGRPVAAVGFTAGAGWQVALLGASPSYARIRVGFPAWVGGITLDAWAPQVVFETEKIF